MSTHTKPTTATLLLVGDFAFEIASSKLAEATRLIEFLAGAPCYKHEYIGRLLGDEGPSTALLEAEAPDLAVEIKPRVRISKAEHAKLVEQYARAKATTGGGK
jgi:hypothetical protein